MIITHHGNGSVKVSQGDLALVFNPQSKLSADVTLFSTGRTETSDKSGFVIEGPGEYEIKDIFIRGFISEGMDKKVNTIYSVIFEGMNLCFLGSLSNTELPAKTLESMENIDILFVPVDTLDSSKAYKLAVSLEPSVIIPTNYSKASLEKFLKEGGETKVESQEKLVVKKKDLEGKEGEIMVLKEA